jgi:hypothetical protein
MDNLLYQELRLRLLLVESKEPKSQVALTRELGVERGTVKRIMAGAAVRQETLSKVLAYVLKKESHGITRLFTSSGEITHSPKESR